MELFNEDTLISYSCQEKIKQMASQFYSKNISTSRTPYMPRIKENISQ